MSTTLAKYDGDMILFGCGTMAGAMLTRWLAKGLAAEHVLAIRPSGAKAPGGVRTKTNAERVGTPDIIVIGVKPQIFSSVSAEIAKLAGPKTLIISIMAGIALEDLRLALPDAGNIVRAMPNLPVIDGRGVIAVVSEAPDKRIDMLMSPLGHVHVMEDEAGFNLVTALTGCGPAFVYRFAAAMAGAAVRLGLNEQDANTLARATLAGAAATLAASDHSAAELADAVASPGGMTQAGLDVLDSDGRLAALLAETLRAARDRGRELSATLRGD
ncbi:MAG: pyrroline-5-carboxylate reductase dimerization domain-containing protein [Pseudomonadota bacterium]